ncbi:MAG: isoprenylcysteine carboxylmethyltransferase family protein [Gemmatimonadota bacterium]|nr:MAG: isoprenylcysteine carboxylmethyltransferase family protein [Gemmatimonadota bacterium]
MRNTRFAKIFGSGPIGLAISLILLLLAFWINKRLDPPPILGDQLVRSSILLVSILMTIALVVWSLKSLPASDRGNRLCTDGAFKYVRHPLYAAFLSVFNIGLAVYLNSYVFVLWTVILHPIWHYAIRYEERLMIEIFGNQYLEYQRKTGRFLPKLTFKPWHTP